MKRRHLSIIVLAGFLSACAAQHTKQMAQENRQSINDALAEAAAVTIPEVEAPADEILDDLVPASDISVPSLNADVRPETAFDISVSNAPAKLFFMSLVKDTNINMVVHPSVSGEISLDLKNVTVSNFSVEVQCSATTHTEGVTAITTYQLTSIASGGVFGSLDYVQRRLQATVSLDPP